MAGEISPLDGRYRERVGHLSRYFSEQALMRARCQVELRWLLALDQVGLFPPLTEAERARVDAALGGFSEEDYLRIKEIEGTLRHDLKACERFLVERLELARPQLVHFGLTSEDVNNLAYSTLLDEYRREAQLPLLVQLLRALAERVGQWKDAPFPARTHGQLASPTTAGKELAVFLHRLVRQHRALRELRFSGKLNGATGNLSALVAAAPSVDWLDRSASFVRSLGLEPNLITTQIEDHDTWAAYFSITAQVNNIVTDLDRDCWSYISRGYLVQKARPGEVGSSTMPHKVNPINFENSEGNLALSTSLLHTLSDRLCCSRMQRDLTDSTVERNIGLALAHSYLALTETLQGLSKIDLDEARCRGELSAAPELLTEPYQTILRLAGVADPYELLRQASRGQRIDEEGLRAVVRGLELPAGVAERLSALTVTGYVGLAGELCELALDETRKELSS